MTLIKVSGVGPYGLLVDGSWINFSKGCLAQIKASGQTFFKGDYNVTLDSKGKIATVAVEGALANNVSNQTQSVIPSQQPLEQHQREILKGQLTNIVLNKLSLSQLYDIDFRKRCYELVLVMLKELELIGFYGW